MGAILNPYLHFRGNAREAMQFYESVFGGELTLLTFGESGSTSENAENIMHAHLSTPSGFTIQASDATHSDWPTGGTSISIGGDASTDAELTGYFERISAGGTVVEPLATAPWGDRFGMCKDRFGTMWLFNISGAPS